MTTTWKIYNLEHQIADGLVIKVTYGCIVQQDTFLDRHIDNITLIGDSSDPDFIPYEDLTEQIVLGWVNEELGQQAISDIEAMVEARVQGRIDEEAAQTTTEGLPWVL